MQLIFLREFFFRYFSSNYIWSSIFVCKSHNFTFNIWIEQQYDVVRKLLRRIQNTYNTVQWKSSKHTERNLVVMIKNAKKVKCLFISYNYADGVKSYVRYIFTSLYCMWKQCEKSTCEKRKNVFYFTLKALFVLEIIKF